ncbi:hypothetical protein CYY_000266 [Polysphondylium violaceum]|uniref:Uncharacterized protein n=1 Tax=Polysphondylium violaceum TaxID=133409 RepID=A0A8J4Q513_9MYCE|nr:hypothetical protein CYY_000266 [Polysphondylium violaceum]
MFFLLSISLIFASFGLPWYELDSVTKWYFRESSEKIEFKVFSVSNVYEIDKKYENYYGLNINQKNTILGSFICGLLSIIVLIFLIICYGVYNSVPNKTIFKHLIRFIPWLAFALTLISCLSFLRFQQAIYDDCEILKSDKYRFCRNPFGTWIKTEYYSNQVTNWGRKSGWSIVVAATVLNFVSSIIAFIVYIPSKNDNTI